MNQWDERFKEPQYVYGTEPNPFVKQYTNAFAHKRDIACYAEGEGRNAVFLAELGKQVTAYDYAKEGLLKTKKLAAERGVQIQTKLVDLLQDDLLHEAYDGAVMIFGHFPKQQQYAVLNKIIDSLKPGGVLLLEVYEDGQLSYQTGGPRDALYLYNEQQLKQWAQTFNVLHFYSGEAERREGILHTGVCKVVQCIISK